MVASGSYTQCFSLIPTHVPPPDDIIRIGPSPAKSALARPRAPKKRKARRKGRDTKQVSPSVRAYDYMHETLMVDNGKLFCRACFWIFQSTKLSRIKQHVALERHITLKEKFAERGAQQRLMTEQLALQAKLKQLNVNPETLSRRMDVTSAFMTSGIPLSKLESKVSALKDVLETNNPKLVVASGMREFVPLINAKEDNLMKSELKTKSCSATPVSVFFDGATR